MLSCQDCHRPTAVNYARAAMVNTLCQGCSRERQLRYPHVPQTVHRSDRKSRYSSSLLQGSDMKKDSIDPLRRSKSRAAASTGGGYYGNE